MLAATPRRPGAPKGRCPRAALALASLLFLLPPLAADQAWERYQDGSEAFATRRLDLALADWQEAIALRKERFGAALASIDVALALPEAEGLRDSISRLVDRLALAEFGPRQYAGFREAAGSSTRRLYETLHRATKTQVFANFTAAWLAVDELRGASAFGDSLKALRALAEGLENYPEAEFGLGKVFFAEGELGLAELQYRKALDEAAFLELPEARYEILGALAELARARADWKDYEELLRSSLAEAELFADSSAFLRTAMERALDLQGFDALVRLYPVTELRLVDPAAALGEYLLRNGRPQAALYLAVSADAALTRVVASIREEEPRYTYAGLPEIASRIAKRPELAAWCESRGLWRTLYYLGEALLADSRLDAGRGLLRSLAASQGSGAWGRAASQALARPLGTKPAALP